MATSRAKASKASAAKTGAAGEDSGAVEASAMKAGEDSGAMGESALPEETGSRLAAAESDGAAASFEVLEAPLESPEAKKARSPHMGLPDSSSNPVSAHAALNQPVGTRHHDIVDNTNTPVKLADVFEWPEEGDYSGLAVVKKTVKARFYYPGTDRTLSEHLLFPKDRRVPVLEAKRLVETYKYAETAEIPASELPPEPPEGG